MRGIKESIIPILVILLLLSFPAYTNTIKQEFSSSYARIYNLTDEEISPEFPQKVDRIVEEIGKQFYIPIEELRPDRFVIWIVDKPTLQKMYRESLIYKEGVVVEALYDPIFNRIFLTPPIEDYPLRHELIHHFMDEYYEEIPRRLGWELTLEDTQKELWKEILEIWDKWWQENMQGTRK